MSDERRGARVGRKCVEVIAMTTKAKAACAAALAVCVGAGALAGPAAAERVTIIRDSRGEPHIQARSASGAAYGLGRAMIEDQAAYIYTALAGATGRSAELVPDCQASLQACFNNDQAAHLFRVPETAYDKYGSLSRGDRDRYKRFAQAINDFAGEHPQRVPSWAFHVNPEDIVAYGQYPFVMPQASGAVSAAAGGGGGGGEADVSNAMGRAIEDGADSFGFLGASNMFALAGSKTASGKPILEGDPHLPFEGATQWYAAQVEYPGTSVSGVTFRGFPAIAMGTNGKVAWAHTANHGNQHEADAYLEQLQPGSPNSYLYGGSYRSMDVETVPIEVQTAPGQLRTVDVRLRYTIHGPVISDPVASVNGTQPTPGTGVAIAATVSTFEQVRVGSQAWAENEADSLAELRDAMAKNQISGYNTIAADAGHIFFTSGGRNGILAPGLPLSGRLDGTDPNQTWKGILPFDQVPQAMDPPSGYYQNANNSPWYSAPGQIVKSEVPYYLAMADGNGPRSRRQIALLDPASNVSLGQTRDLALDDFVEISPSLKSLLAAAATGGSTKVVSGNDLIQAWDGRAEMNSTAYPLFATWVRGLSEAALGFRVANPPPPSTAWTAAQINEARSAMTRAYDGMTTEYGTIAVRYGDVHTLTRGDFTGAVNGGDSGALATLRMTNCKGEPGENSPDYYHPCAVRGGSGAMFHTDLANEEVLEVLRPVADTDDSASPFYTENARAYVADRFRGFPITDEAVERDETSRRRLRIPGTKPPPMRVRSRRVPVSDEGRFRVRVGCPARKGQRCRGDLVLEAVQTKGKGGVPFARERFNLRRGGGVVVGRLRQRPRRIVARQGRLRARVVLTIRELDDVSREKQRVVLRNR